MGFGNDVSVLDTKRFPHGVSEQLVIQGDLASGRVGSIEIQVVEVQCSTLVIA